jgi:hypothetical protein
LTTINWAIGIDLFTHAGEERARDARGARLRCTLVGFVDFECNLVELRDWVAANFARSAVLVGYTLGAILKATADCDGGLLDLADDQYRGNDPRDQALKHNSLVVVDWNGSTVGRVRDCVGRRRGVFGVRGRRGRRVMPARWLIDIDNVHNKRIWGRIST